MTSIFRIDRPPILFARSYYSSVLNMVRAMPILFSCVLVISITSTTAILGDSSKSFHQDSSLGDIRHTIEFRHPGSKKTGLERNVLVQRRLVNDLGEVRNIYFMDASSVFCGENVCKVDVVRVFWDEFGRYQRFELAPEVILEKNKETYFTQIDYEKLHLILAKPDNGLRLLHKDELIVPRGGANAVDALTGATVSLHKGDYVQGAIWTCYTLWHFANGEIVDIIRNNSASEKSLLELKTMLAQGDLTYRIFALESIIRRRHHGQEIWENIDELLIRLPDDALYLVLEYLALVPEALYLDLVLSILEKEDVRLRFFILKALSLSSKPLSELFFMTLADELAKWNNYREFDQYFTLLIEREINSNSLSIKLSALLKHPNFLFSRRVYWFLSQRAGSSEILDRELEAYFRANEYRL